MILPFSKQINGKETYFAEKIVKYLGLNFLSLKQLNNSDKYFYSLNIPHWITDNPKIHTIRKDEKNRWKTGNKIHAVYNNRSKNQYQIAPTFECKGIQTIELNFDTDYCLIRVAIENQVKYYPYSEHEGIERKKQTEWLSNFAKNDGFDKVGDFQDFFEPTLKKNKSFTFKGKIIHFTDLLY
jgi:hypothetical protein